MSATTSASSATPSLGSDAKLIGLVGLAHAISHFSQLILPPLALLVLVVLWLNRATLALDVKAAHEVTG